ncbi:MAG: thiol-disulfide isomerase/thioredoxin [Alphaproteobacteria bacterium]|jgi:thiol-disulfide isomerase/thioredoxin
MIKKLLLPVIAIASGLAIWSVLAQKSSEIPTAPPLTGWMQNFTPTVPAGPALEGKLLAEDGKVASLSDFRGKLVLVNFWATWCLPCIREMPSLLRLQKKRGGDDFIVLALAQDFNGWKMVAPFLQRRDLSGLPVYVDEKTAISRSVRIPGLPVTMLLDRDGKILGHLVGIAEWDSAEAVALIDYYAKQKKGRRGDLKEATNERGR